MIKIPHIRTIFQGKNEYLASKKHFQRVTEEIENIIFLLEMIFFKKTLKFLENTVSTAFPHITSLVQFRFQTLITCKRYFHTIDDHLLHISMFEIWSLFVIIVIVIFLKCFILINAPK